MWGLGFLDQARLLEKRLGSVAKLRVRTRMHTRTRSTHAPTHACAHAHTHAPTADPSFCNVVPSFQDLIRSQVSGKTFSLMHALIAMLPITCSVTYVTALFYALIRADVDLLVPLSRSCYFFCSFFQLCAACCLLFNQLTCRAFVHVFVC